MASRSGQSIHKTQLFLVLFVSSTLLLAVSVNTRYFTPIELALRWLVQPIDFIAHVPKRVEQLVSDYFISLDDLRANNEQLMADVSLLNATLAELKHAKTIIEELQAVLNYAPSQNVKQALAEISRINPNRQRQEVIINVGSEQGVSLDSCTLDPWGLYGRIVEVFPNSSRVLLINDERHATPVMVRRTQQYFIASGNGPNELLTLDKVNLSTDIQVGDELITSGLGGVFPEGLLLGDVTAISDNVAESTKHVTVAPKARLEAKHYLRVISQVGSP